MESAACSCRDRVVAKGAGCKSRLDRALYDMRAYLVDVLGIRRSYPEHYSFTRDRLFAAFGCLVGRNWKRTLVGAKSPRNIYADAGPFCSARCCPFILRADALLYLRISRSEIAAFDNLGFLDRSVLLA